MIEKQEYYYGAANHGVPQRRKRLIMLASKVGAVQLPADSRKKLVVADVLTGLEQPARTKDELHRMFLKSSPRILNLIKKIPKNGGSRSDLGKRHQLECHKEFRGFFDVYGRMSWKKTSPTLTGGCFNPSKGRFLHPTQNRAITMREAALLQTFPRWYKFPTEVGITTVARMIGDAVPPKFAKKQAREILRSFENKR